MSKLSLMFKLIPVVSAGGCGIGSFKEEARDCHRGEKRPETEHGKVKIILFFSGELSPVPVSGGNE